MNHVNSRDYSVHSARINTLSGIFRNLLSKAQKPSKPENQLKVATESHSPYISFTGICLLPPRGGKKQAYSDGTSREAASRVSSLRNKELCPILLACPARKGKRVV